MILIFKTMKPCRRQAWALALVGLSACTSPLSKTKDAGTTLRNELLEATGACALQTVRAFRDDARALAAAPSRTTWQSAMKTWQRLEMMQFGPTGSSLAPGGQDFRDHIYAWPLVSRCAMDEVLVSKSYESGVSALLVNRRGLAALEYLLFYENDDVVCSAEAWAKVSGTDRKAQKAKFVEALAVDLKVRAEGLASAWEGGFVETLRTAGPGNATYPTAQGALNRVSDALFYLEKEVKDAKLAKPLGLRDCASPPCLDAVESPYARHDLHNLRANLFAFRQATEGCGDGFSGMGFDDVLAASGASSLSTRLRERAVAAQAALEAIEEPSLKDALVADPASVRALYDAVKAVTDLMKSELTTVLDLELPLGLEGDND